MLYTIYIKEQSYVVAHQHQRAQDARGADTISFSRRPNEGLFTIDIELRSKKRQCFFTRPQVGFKLHKYHICSILIRRPIIYCDYNFTHVLVRKFPS